MIIPFRFKLTFIIASMITIVLLVILSIVQSNIEEKFRIVIENQLKQVNGFVKQSMDERYELLRSDAFAASEDSLVRDILIDNTLPGATRDDIIKDEVMPKFNHLNVLAVTNIDGVLLASNNRNNKVTMSIIKSVWFSYVYDGEDIAGYVLVNEQYYQAIAMPVFLSKQMIGVVIVARSLGLNILNKIKEVSYVDMALLNSNQRVSSTEWSSFSSSGELLSAFDQWMIKHHYGEKFPEGLIEVKLAEERFLLRFIQDETEFVPPFVIVRSLDEALSFVRNIQEVIFLIGLIAIFISALVGFFVAIGVSNPIKKLQKATREVAKENFRYQVDINSQDEFSALGDSFNEMIINLGEKQKIRSAFDKSVSKEIADHMLENGVELGGVKQTASILFSDIRGFTQLAEHMDEKQLINLLNEYFSAVNQSIINNKGLIDKFIGDAVMALFGTPVEQENSSVYAINAALDMLDALEEFNLNVANKYDCEIKIGIGINTGNLVAGLVGSKERLNFTVLGDHVNLASRIEGLSKFYGADILISELTLDNFKKFEPENNQIIFRYLDTVQVKGRTQGMRIYQPMKLQDEKESMFDRIKQYELSVNYIQQKELKKAQKLLVSLVKDWPLDRPTSILLENVNAYIRNETLYDIEYKQKIRIHSSK